MFQSSEKKFGKERVLNLLMLMVTIIRAPHTWMLVIMMNGKMVLMMILMVTQIWPDPLFGKREQRRKTSSGKERRSVNKMSNEQVEQI